MHLRKFVSIRGLAAQPGARQLYRAMNQLERLQRMRRGEPIPSPVLMEVGHAA